MSEDKKPKKKKKAGDVFLTIVLIAAICVRKAQMSIMRLPRWR